MIAAWPVLGRWQARLNNHPRVQFLLRLARSQGFQRVLRAAIVATFVAFIGLAIVRNWAELQQYEWHADLRYLLIAVVAFPLAYLPTVWCWHWILRRISGFSSLRINAHIYFLSSMGRYMPGAIWYIAGRAYWYKEQKVPTSHVIIATLWENVIFISSGLIIYALLGWQQGTIAVLAIILTAFLFPMILNRLVGFAQRRVGQDQLPPVRPVDVLVLYAALGFAWIAGGCLLWWVANAIHPLELDVLPYLIADWGLVGAVSVIAGFLVGGLGIREIALSALLGQVMPLPVALVVALVFRLTLMVSEALWALTLSVPTRPKVRITRKD